MNHEADKTHGIGCVRWRKNKRESQGRDMHKSCSLAYSICGTSAGVGWGVGES